MGLGADTADGSCKTKVGYFVDKLSVASFFEQNIFRFYISMDKIFLVNAP